MRLGSGADRVWAGGLGLRKALLEESRDGWELGRSDRSESDSGSIGTFWMTWSVEGRTALADIMRTGQEDGRIIREMCVDEEWFYFFLIQSRNYRTHNPSTTRDYARTCNSCRAVC